MISVIPHRIGAGPLQARIVDGDLCGLTCGGTEVLRRLSVPVRDADWGTVPVVTVQEDFAPASYARTFRAADGGFQGRLDIALHEARGQARMTARVTIRALRDLVVNRAGFTLLHPIDGVAGTALRVTHPDGRVTDTTFPALISPGQPARDIAGLAHRIGPVEVRIALTGDTFEMEDQRNWSDASFKTYGRPLSLPRPYALPAGAEVTQAVTLDLTLHPGAPATPPRISATGRMPEVLLAQDMGMPAAPGPLLTRITGQTPLAGLAPHALEIVFDDLADLTEILSRAAGLTPVRVTALPAAYLASHQPEGPWPHGATQADATPLLRRAFPGALIGGGSLTHFTEFNRHRPDPGQVDFATFGNCAIVHAADDASVIQTLDALPHIFASAHAVTQGKPLHLGLLSIGMRSNPYGASVAANPDHRRLPMASDDPRQRMGFAAAYAVGVLVAAVAGRVDSLALAMTTGPLAATGPLARVIAGARAMAGQAVAVTHHAGVWRIDGPMAGMLANLGNVPVAIPQAGLLLTADGDIRQTEDGMLEPHGVFLWGGAT